MVSRRGILKAGGCLLASLICPAALAGQKVTEIRMRGNADGSDVWFDPIGILIRPGETIRWTNADSGNSHTATAYHPRNDNHPLRIPPGAEPWNSDYLLPDEHFEVTLATEGVYDYYCIPHEQAGMVGRIIVGEPSGLGMRPSVEALRESQSSQPLPEAIERAFPDLDEIIRFGAVRRR
jgi:plastocyanin